MNIRFFVVSFLLLGFVFDSQGQSPKSIDSLQIVLASTEGLSRIPTLFELSYAYVGRDNDEALRYAWEGYRLSLCYGDSLHLVRTGLLMASALRRMERHDSAAGFYSVVLPVAERNGYVRELSEMRHARPK